MSEDNQFERVFKSLLSEDMTAGDGGVLGDFNGGDNADNTDWYAPGDNRIPKVIGNVQRRRRKKKKKDDEDDDNVNLKSVDNKQPSKNKDTSL